MDIKTALELSRSLRDRLERYPQVASKRDLRAFGFIITEADDSQTMLDGPTTAEEGEDEQV